MNLFTISDKELNVIAKDDCYGLLNDWVCRGYSYADTGKACPPCTAKRERFFRMRFGIRKN